MKIKVDLFCSLATDAAWQAWLYRFDAKLYQSLVEHLAVARGCGQNKEKMTELLGVIASTPEGSDKLAAFIQERFPYLIEPETPQSTAAARPLNQANVFEQYAPHVLTYPRRHIISGEPTKIKELVRQFLVDKGPSEHVIVGNKAYIEFLLPHEAHLREQIPAANWQVLAYKKK